MTHLKRQELPRNWPVPRKGTVYIVKSLADFSLSIPLIVALRDILKISQNRKEVKRSIQLKQVLLNANKVADEKINLSLFDTLSILPSNKHYKLELSEKGKFKINEIPEKESHYKVAKIINKKTLKGKKTQINLSDGRNFLSNIECKTNDSVLINLKESKIEKCLPLKENSKAVVFAGKHNGESGIIKSISPDKKMAVLESKNSSANVLIKHLIITQ